MHNRAEPFFQTRGVVLSLADLTTWDWPRKAKAAGLSTLATHGAPAEIAAFMQADGGRALRAECAREGIALEHEWHALRALLPRQLFERNPALFRVNERGERTPDYNLCAHSEAALAIVMENVQAFARILRTATHRYFFWIDDACPMCHCAQCRGLSDSDQALIVENHMLKALRAVDPRATLAHLAYGGTLAAPTQVRPEPGIFLEFAPIQRRYDTPFSRREACSERTGQNHGQVLDILDANLAWFGVKGAQALEYWLDVSLFSRYRKETKVKAPWNREMFLDDLNTYGRRGIRHITTFGVYIDADYVRRHGEPPLNEYGAGLRAWRPETGKA